MYEINVNHLKKEVYVFADGFFTLEEANSFIAEYKRKTGAVNTSDYNLIVNTKDLKTSTPEVAEKLVDVIAMYMVNPYKARYSVKLSNAVAQMQVNRMGRTIEGFSEGMTFVTDEAEAYKLINK